MANFASVGPTWPNYSTANVQTAASKDNQSMGENEFLKILITQLQNQDPMQPLQDKDFIAQMAQFTSVEQLLNINKQLTSMNQSLGSASGLIGKEISWMQIGTDGSSDYNMDGDSSDGTTTMQGVVEAIIVRSGAQYAKVGTHEVPIDQILQISNPHETAPPTPSADEAAGGGKS